MSVSSRSSEDRSTLVSGGAASSSPTRTLRPDLFAIFVGVLAAGALFAQLGLIAWLSRF